MSTQLAPSAFERLLDPIAECLTPEVARRLVNLRADESTQSLVDQFAYKASAGTLSEAESAEYAKYREAFHVITILQAKARQALARHESQ